MFDVNTAPPCGYTCGGCSHFRKDCAGCRQTEGKPYWSSYVENSRCPIYYCCTNERLLEHCGLCSQLPCETFLKLRDPSLSDEEFQKSLNERLTILRKRAGTSPG
ncbi:MAG: DUF3795 domain-containing protein [Candidatus Wallbacteria bacterium]|nr:DUF3795 domain-containing protein [Candidatus Wallbacteria bacterium]